MSANAACRIRICPRRTARIDRSNGASPAAAPASSDDDGDAAFPPAPRAVALSHASSSSACGACAGQHARERTRRHTSPQKRAKPRRAAGQTPPARCCRAPGTEGTAGGASRSARGAPRQPRPRSSARVGGTGPQPRRPTPPGGPPAAYGRCASRPARLRGGKATSTERGSQNEAPRAQSAFAEGAGGASTSSSPAKPVNLPSSVAVAFPAHASRSAPAAAPKTRGHLRKGGTYAAAGKTIRPRQQYF